MFKKYKNLFDNNKMFELLKYEDAILWLKLRAISRKELLNDFIKTNDLNIELLKILFNIKNSIWVNS